VDFQPAKWVSAKCKYPAGAVQNSVQINTITSY
jgi:hypothetical protein